MYILGLESSCDETSASVVRMSDGVRRICSNVIASQTDIHRLYGGVVPEIAGRAHIEAISGITYRALEEAGIGICDVGAVAVTTNPGLIGALLVGVNFAKSLAFSKNLPLVPVNHIKAHVAAAYLCDAELRPPFAAVVVSGGHTSIYNVRDYNDFEEIGATRDDAAGEAFDKIARVIGIPYPGGAGLDKLASKGNCRAYSFPSPALGGARPDFSFSGIKTAALNLINSARQRGEEISREDLAASYTDAVVRAIVSQSELALSMVLGDCLVLCGGVAANSHLRMAMSKMCRRNGIRFTVPDLSLCGDNGAMVAAAGYYEYLCGNLADTSLNASALDLL